jgi:hypothetical protein
MKRLQKIVLFLIFFITHERYTIQELYAIQAQDNLIDTACLLTKASYVSAEMQKNVLIFMGKDPIENKIDSIKNIPSVEEIITKISQLQDKHGSIENLKIKKQALDALDTAIKAIEITILKIRLKYQEGLAESATNLRLVDILSNQKKILQEKITELDGKSIWSYIAKPSTTHVLAAFVLTMALGGAAYYYNFLKWEKADLNEEEQNRALSLEESSMQTGSKNLEHLHENPRIKIRNIVAKFIDPHDKQHTSVVAAVMPLLMVTFPV